MGPIDNPSMAIIALGTLGDILPLLTLSCELMVTSKESVRIIFVTNAAHKNTVDSYIKHLPEGKRTENRFRAEYMQCSPLSFSLEPMRSDFYDMDSVDDACRKVALMSDLILVIANLFCLAGYLVAEFKCVRCILIHPHKPPSKMPPNFKSMLKRRLPNFYRQLFAEPTTCRERDEGILFHRRNKVCEDDDIEEKLPDILDSCCWQDYEEWLWPTLTSMYDSTRRVLKLQSVSSPSYVIPRRPIVLLVQSPQFYPPPGYWPSDRYIVSGCITHDQLTCRSLPATATASSQNSFHATPPLLPSFFLLIDEFLSRQDCNTVCVDFGSMTELLASQYEWGTFCTTLLSLASLNFSFIMNCQSSFYAIMESFIAASQCRGNRCPSSPSSPSSSAPGAAMYSTRTIGSNRTIEIEGVLLLEGHVEHTLIFRKCVAVVHHGGAGTLSTCLRSGVPQVVMPIIHDQHDNADRLQYMHMTPDSVPIAKLYPKRKRHQNQSTSPPVETIELEESVSATERARVDLVEVEDGDEIEVEIEVEPITADAEDDAEAEGIAAAVALMGQRLQWSCTPAHRLRCGCFGRDMRSQQSEGGLENVLGVVMKELTLEMEGREKKDVAEEKKYRKMEGAEGSAFLTKNRFVRQNISNDNSSSSSGGRGNSSMRSDCAGGKGCHDSTKRAEIAPGSDEGGVEWQELGDSMMFATHHLTAPEETAFLFNEVFLQRTYMRHGISLAENDLVIDVGANIGFFAVFAELEFDVPDALRIIAIEPCSKNFKLLQQNMKLYAPTAHLVQAAISSVPKKRKRNLNCADGNVGKHRKRVSKCEWVSNQHEVGHRHLRSSMRDREGHVERLTGEEGDATVEGAENMRVIFVKDEDEDEDEDEDSEVVGDEIAEGKEEEEEGEEHVFMTYYPRMPGNSKMTHYAGEGPSYSNSFFQTGSCQERVVVKTLSDVIDDYERQNKDTDRCEDSDGSGDHYDDTGASVLHSGETRGGDTRGNIALLKVDVEGSELCALQSLELRHWNRIDQIVVETERPKEGAEGSAGDIINCNAHSTEEKKQNCGADSGKVHQQSNYCRIYNLLKLHGFRVVEEWGDPDGYDTGCLLLFGIKDRR